MLILELLELLEEEFFTEDVLEEGQWVPYTDKGPTKADLDFSIKKIDEVIKKVTEMRDGKYAGQKKYATAFDWTLKRLDLAKKLHEIIPEFNKIKKPLDAAYAANDVEKFQKAFNDYQNFAREIELTSMLKTINQRVTLQVNAAKEYIERTRAVLDFFSGTLSGGKDILKRMKMSDKQRSAADNSSARMRGRWAE
jgi:cysteinyl-tRNA synthetase